MGNSRFYARRFLSRRGQCPRKALISTGCHAVLRFQSSLAIQDVRLANAPQCMVAASQIEPRVGARLQIVALSEVAQRIFIEFLVKRRLGFLELGAGAGDCASGRPQRKTSPAPVSHTELMRGLMRLWAALDALADGSKNPGAMAEPATRSLGLAP